MKLKALESGTCDNVTVVSAAPNSTTGEIAAAKNAAVIMVVPLANFIGRKIETIRGKPTTACPQTGPDIIAPLAAPCLATVQTGGSRTVKASATAKAVEIVVVPAAHDSTAPIALVSEAMRKNLEVDNASLTLGPPSGYVIRFTNGLTAYLTGDTGIHAEMQTVERDFYKVNLMELNHGASALAGRSRLRGQHAGAARLGDPVACQRSRDQRRQSAPDLTQRRVHRAGAGTARLSGAERQDDGV
jgi:hypothetical protein